MKYANRPLSLLVAGALVVTLAGCGGSAVSTTTATSAAGTVLSAAETEFSLEGATTFTFTDGGISAAEGDYDGYTIEGTALTISEPGTYAVSGSCADGSITIKAGTEDVTLVLNGLELTSTTTAPIVCGKSTGVTIAVQSGTQNTLADTAANNKDSENASADAESAVLKCKDGAQDVAADSDYTLTAGSTTLATATAQTGKSSASFGGMGGGQNGMTPPDGANGQTPPAMNGSAPGREAPDGQQGSTPPEKPAGTPSGSPPQMPAQNNATSQAETAAG